jgi:hypothetical protein
MSDCIIHLDKPFIMMMIIIIIAIIIFSFFNVSSRRLDYIMADMIINKQQNGKTVEVQYT